MGMNKDKCRWCKHYRPDERHNGVVGWCEVKDRPMAYNRTCDKIEQGTQKWMCGKGVVE